MLHKIKIYLVKLKYQTFENLNINNRCNVSITSLMDEKDLLSSSTRSGANINVYPQYSQDYWRSSYCTAIKVKLKSHKIYTKI